MKSDRIDHRQIKQNVFVWKRYSHPGNGYFAGHSNNLIFILSTRNREDHHGEEDECTYKLERGHGSCLQILCEDKMINGHGIIQKLEIE